MNMRSRAVGAGPRVFVRPGWGARPWATVRYLDTVDSLRFARDASVSEASSSLPLGPSAPRSAQDAFALTERESHRDPVVSPSVSTAHATSREGTLAAR